MEVMLFGKETKDKCGRILKHHIPGQLAEGLNKGKLPLKLLSQISNRDEFILLHRPQPDEYWCLFVSGQEGVTRIAQRNHLRTLSCGFSPYDTLVISSATPEQAVISLQREIQTGTDHILEPGDYVVHRNPYSSDPAVLLCAGTLLLMDKGQEERVFYF